MTDAIHLGSNPNTVRWGRLPVAGARPVAEAASGDVVIFDTVSHEGILPDQGGDPVAFFGARGIDAAQVLDDVVALVAAGLPRDPARDGPHVVTGPVAVAAARPGDVLAVETVALERRTDYGIISNRHGRGVLSGELPRAVRSGEPPPPVVSLLATVAGDGRTGCLRSPNGRTLRFPLAPFLGLVGVAPAADQEPSSTPPGPHGGNLDIRHLGVGSTLFLPVQADGALLYAGDPHFAQGNGEVALTAFEAPLRATLKVGLIQGGEARRLAALLRHPWGTTERHLVAVGLGATLDEAMVAAVRHALIMVVEATGVDEATALAFLSAAADFEVSQAVNGVRGVHCLIRRGDLEPEDARTTVDPEPP